MSDSSPAILGEPTEEGAFVVGAGEVVFAGVLAEELLVTTVLVVGVVVVVLAAVPDELPVRVPIFGVLAGAGV